MIVISIGNIVTHLYFGLNSIIRASGNPRTAMGLTLFTVISNAILDPLFIYTFHLGIQGAAIATVLCQTLALIYTLIYFCGGGNFLRLKLRSLLRIDWGIARDSLKIGMAPFLMHLASCVVAIFVNNQLLKYGGDLAIGAYGINNRLTFLFVMICLGLNQGMQPIAGYNFGARLYSRVKQVYTKTALWATLVCAVGCIVALFTPRLAVRIFTNDPPMIDLAEHGLRLMNCIFIIEPLPVPRHGPEIDPDVALAPAAVPRSLPVSAAAVVRTGRRLAQFPDLGRPGRRARPLADPPAVP